MVIVGECTGMVSEKNINHSSSTFDGYTIYKGNRSAVKTAKRIICRNSKKKIPIIITGVTASGKTRLLRAICDSYSMKGIKVHSTAAKDIVKDVVDSIRAKADYKRQLIDKYIQNAVLLIDDLQEFFGKQNTLYEISTLVYEMSARDKQVVCSVKTPCNLLNEAMGAFIKTNRSARVVRIDLPNRSERLKIIKKKAIQIEFEKGIYLNKEVIGYMARSCCDIARIEGAFKYILLYSTYYKRQIGASQIKQLIKVSHK